MKASTVTGLGGVALILAVVLLGLRCGPCLAPPESGEPAAAVAHEAFDPAHPALPTGGVADRTEVPDEPLVAGRFLCRVLRASDDAPLPDVRVRWLARGADLGITVLRELTTDGAGLVDLRVERFEDTALVVERVGHSRAFAPVESGHETRATAVELRLRPEATLVAFVRGVGGSAVAGLCVRANLRDPEPAPGDDWPDERERAPTSFEAVTAGDGRAVLRGLPAGPAVEVGVWEGTLPLLRLEPRQMLEPGEARELTLQVGSRAKLRGRVVDQHGAPVADCTLVLVPEEVGKDWAVRWWRESRIHAWTGPDGRFECRDLPEGPWLVSPAAEGAWIAESSRSLAPFAQRVVVASGGDCTEAEVRVWRGVTLRGTVTLASGGPAGGCVVAARPVEPSLGDGLSGACDAHGRFVLGPVAPVEYAVEAGGVLGGEYGRSTRVRVTGGQDSLALTVERAASLRVVALRSHGRESAWPHLMLCRAGDPVGEPPLSFQSQARTFDVAGLTPGAWTVYASDEVGAGATRIELGPGEDRAVELALLPASRLKFKNRSRADSVVLQIRIGDLDLPEFHVEPRGQADWLLPPGAATVRAWNQDGNELAHRTLALTAGAIVTLRLP